MKRKSIVKQAVDRLQDMAAWGHSKHQDKAANGGKPALEKIYSHCTMDNYKAVAATYAGWAREAHGCRDIDQARQYTGEYLRGRMAVGLSAWTVRRDAAALAKLYQCQTTELGAELPTRHRGDITQHRGGKSKGHFSEARHKDLADLCRATGLRRHEVAQLRPGDVEQIGGKTFVTVQQGKGGKYRRIEALNDAPARLAEKAQGRDRLIEHIPKYAPCHEWRAEFAQAMYRQLARDPVQLPAREVYRCRADRAGVCYDKQAMKAVSLALGHARLDVVTNYIK